MTVAELPAHMARVDAALSQRGLHSSQNGDPAARQATCPACGRGEFVFRDVDWDEHGRRKVQLYCPDDDDPEILKALGLRERDLFLDTANRTGDGDDPAAVEPVGAVTFVSPEELRASVPPEPPWRWHGYLAAGALTILAGKPKAGKSTLALAISGAIDGRAPTFLDHAVDGAPVVYVSEEGAATLAHKVGGGLRIATRDTAWPRPDWPSLIDAAAAEAERVQAALLVIDTFAFWAALGPESEKDAGAVQAAMEPLVAATRKGLAVLLVVHARKGGGEDGEAVRGSSALAGAADIVLELDRVPEGAARQRRLLALSRYPQTPGVLVIDHDATNGSWRAIGEGTDRGEARDIGNRLALLDALSGGELTRKEIEEATGKEERGWHATMNHLIEAGEVVKLGAGVKGDPHRFQIVRTDSEQHESSNGGRVVSDAAASPVGGQHQKQDAATFDSAGAAESDAALASRAERILERHALGEIADDDRASRNGDEP